MLTEYEIYILEHIAGGTIVSAMDKIRPPVCCVCDVSAMKNFPTPSTVYMCSKVCEKLFLVTQGIILGATLQSIFRDLYDVRCFPNRTNTIPKDEISDSCEWTNSVFSSFTDSCQERHQENSVHNIDSIGVHQSNRNTSQLKDIIQPANKNENADAYSEQLCESDTLQSDVESSASADQCASDSETTQATINKIDKINIVITARPEHQAHKRKRPGRPRKNDAKTKTNSRQLRLRCNDSRLGEPVHHEHQSAVADINERDSFEEQYAEHKPERIQNSLRASGKCVTCKHCNKVISKSYLYAHYRAVHKEHLQELSRSLLSCSECGKVFLRKQALNAHKLRLHQHKFSIICNDCGKGFDSRLGLSWHMRQVHKVTVRQCGTCGLTFDNRRDYKKHRRNQHSNSSQVCHVCGKGFTLKTALQAHLDAHAGVKLHFCEVCGDGFVRFTSLYQHKNNVHGLKKSELPFKCHLCPSTFKLESWLEKHVQKHQAIDQTKADCEQCQDFLKTSIRCPVHGNAAKDTFPCPHCDKVFGKQTNLRAHMKLHQDPKFSCDVCQKKFTYKCNMLRHRDTHSSHKPYHCDTCARQFCSKFLLASHMRLHNQDLFKCEVCGKGLTRKDYLKNHVKKMHPEHIKY